MPAFMVVVFALLGFATANEESREVHFTNSWAVHLNNTDPVVVNEIATRHGFINRGQIGSLPGYFHFVKHSVQERSRRSLDDHTERLQKEPQVKWAEQQQILERSKRHVIRREDALFAETDSRWRRDTAVAIGDPYFKDQWYLQNIGQSSGPAGIDINVLPAWGRGYTGKGVVVSILDDGVDHTHPDLKRNYDPDASFDFNDFDSDPKPRAADPQNCHGTKCAGEVAAEANNGICGVGVSFNASIGGIRMLDGKLTDTIEGSSLSYRADYIDIYSCCWGPRDDGKRFGKPGTLASKALKIGAERGRGGKGSVFVWATGNGGLTDDDCNCDGYTTSIYTVSIGAISDHGLSTYYTETCASTLAVTFSGGSHREADENKIITTGLNHKCTRTFKGTSSAAPLAAGMLALVLEANPNMTWRDLQHLIVETSQQTSPMDEGWKRNGAGKLYNHKFGFGRLDVSGMVEKALLWKNVGKHRTCHAAQHTTPRFIPLSGSLILSTNTSACSGSGSEIRKLEHVQVMVTLRHRHRGHLSITLISPSGTRSELLTTRRNDHSNAGLKDWVFMTVHCWGEDPKGTWTLVITDNDRNTREHHVAKAKHGDFEDVTRVIMDDTEKQGPWDKHKINEYDHKATSSALNQKGDHILKSIEETEGELMSGNKFADIQAKASRTHWKHHQHKLRHKMVSKILKKLKQKKYFNKYLKLYSKQFDGKNHSTIQIKHKHGKKRHRNDKKHHHHHHHHHHRHHNKHRNDYRRVSHLTHGHKGSVHHIAIDSDHTLKKNNNNRREDMRGNKVDQEEFGAGLDAALEMESEKENSNASNPFTKPISPLAEGTLEVPKDAPLEAKLAIQALANPSIAKIFGLKSGEASKLLLPSDNGNDKYTSEVNIQMKIKKAHDGKHGKIPDVPHKTQPENSPETAAIIPEHNTTGMTANSFEKPTAPPSTIQVTGSTSSNMQVTLQSSKANNSILLPPNLPALIPVPDIDNPQQGAHEEVRGTDQTVGPGGIPIFSATIQFPNENPTGEVFTPPSQTTEVRGPEPVGSEASFPMNPAMNPFPPMVTEMIPLPREDQQSVMGNREPDYKNEESLDIDTDQLIDPKENSDQKPMENPDVEPINTNHTSPQFPTNEPMLVTSKTADNEAEPSEDEQSSPDNIPGNEISSDMPNKNDENPDEDPDSGFPKGEQPIRHGAPLNGTRTAQQKADDQRNAVTDAVRNAMQAVQDGTLDNMAMENNENAATDTPEQSAKYEKSYPQTATKIGQSAMQVTVQEEARPTDPYAGIPGNEESDDVQKHKDQGDVQVLNEDANTGMEKVQDEFPFNSSTGQASATSSNSTDIVPAREEEEVQNASEMNLVPLNLTASFSNMTHPSDVQFQTYLDAEAKPQKTYQMIRKKISPKTAQEAIRNPTKVSVTVPDGTALPTAKMKAKTQENYVSGFGSGSDTDDQSGSGSESPFALDDTGNAHEQGSKMFLKTDKRPTVGSTVSMIVASPEVKKQSENKSRWKTLDCTDSMKSEICEQWRKMVAGVSSPFSEIGGDADIFANPFSEFSAPSDPATTQQNTDILPKPFTEFTRQSDPTKSDVISKASDAISDAFKGVTNGIESRNETENKLRKDDKNTNQKGMTVTTDSLPSEDVNKGMTVTKDGLPSKDVNKEVDEVEDAISGDSTSGSHAGNEPITVFPENVPKLLTAKARQEDTDINDDFRSHISNLFDKPKGFPDPSEGLRELNVDPIDAFSEWDGDMIDKDEDHSNMFSLDMLQDAMRKELSKLTSTPEEESSNNELLRRVGDDINKGDVHDLESLESEIQNELREFKVAGSSDKHEVRIGPKDDDFRVIEKRRVRRNASTRDFGLAREAFHRKGHSEFGERNSGMLKSWSLILYGTR